MKSPATRSPSHHAPAIAASYLPVPFVTSATKTSKSSRRGTWTTSSLAPVAASNSSLTSSMVRRIGPVDVMILTVCCANGHCFGGQGAATRGGGTSGRSPAVASAAAACTTSAIAPAPSDRSKSSARCLLKTRSTLTATTDGEHRRNGLFDALIALYGARGPDV